MFLLLSLTLLSQQHSARDMAFDKIQVDWIASTGVVHDLDHVLSWRQAALIRQLGCNHYECRKLSTDEIQSMGYGAFEALCWGTHIKNRPDIQTECRRLLDRFSVCDHCDRFGSCAHPEMGQHTFYGSSCSPLFTFCGKCGGSRNIFRVLFNIGGPEDYIIEDRILFPSHISKQ